MHGVFHQLPASSSLPNRHVDHSYSPGSVPTCILSLNTGHLSTYPQGNKHRPDLHTVVNKVLTVTVDEVVKIITGVTTQGG